jgi:hypothetical protein
MKKDLLGHEVMQNSSEECDAENT